MKRCARQLVAPWEAWVTLFALVLCLVFDEHLRWSALGFQVLGTLTVTHILVGKVRFFGQASIIEETKTWLRGFGVKSHVPEDEAGIYAVAEAKARMSLWRKGDSSTEARLAALEANIQTLREEQDDLEKALQQEVSNRVEEVAIERRERASAVGSIRNDLISLGAGSIRIERWGVIWLSMSLIFSAWSALKV